MKRTPKLIFPNFKFMNWKNLLIIVVVTMYLTLIGVWVGIDDYPFELGADYLAFWSAGKIADDIGYSEIYNFENLRSVQLEVLIGRGILDKVDSVSFLPFPSPYLSFYILPFRLLSKVDIRYSFWIWDIFNLAMLIGYLVFIIRRIHNESGVAISGLNLLIVVLFSFPVFSNFVNGQLNVLLLICTGEFIRNALNKKSVLSGIWLGGLLLKPQLLILIVPIILLMRYWKVLLGFVVSSVAIILSSLVLSGFTGMKALINLLTRMGEGNSVTVPGAMINWRMIGVYLNTYMNTSLGWVITGAGIILTILAVYRLLKYNPAFGSPEWVVIMLGVFSATLAVTWHAHYHMALVLIPFLIFASVNKLLPESISFFWVVTTPIAWIGIGLASPVVHLFTKVILYDYYGTVIALSGFLVNLMLLMVILKKQRMEIFSKVHFQNEIRST